MSHTPPRDTADSDARKTGGLAPPITAGVVSALAAGAAWVGGRRSPLRPAFTNPTRPVASSVEKVTDPSAESFIRWITERLSTDGADGAACAVSPGVAASPAPKTARQMPCLRNFTVVPSSIFPCSRQG